MPLDGDMPQPGRVPFAARVGIGIREQFDELGDGLRSAIVDSFDHL